MKISDLEGIGPAYARKLENAVQQLLAANEPAGSGGGRPGGGSRLRRKASSGPRSSRSATTSTLLAHAATREQRSELAEMSGISVHVILEWVNLADLYRVKGVGRQYVALLQEVGVDTAVELANLSPEHLHARLLEVNRQKNLVNRAPSLKQVKEWVTQARKLPRVVTY